MKFVSKSGKDFFIDVDDALKYVGIPLSVGSNNYLRITADYWKGDRYVHRDILGAKKGESVDHINGNTLDNRKENLRICTHQQNMCNQKTRTDNKSNVKGVYWSEERQKWCVQIAANNKTIPLGRFNLFEDAVKARKEAEQKYHGEFSRK